ncbi:MAG: hypothetical protein GXO49_05080, partial [Chlorobi bacterium]|nr:hypothetical protein [Chlorobiota bacterium]
MEKKMIIEKYLRKDGRINHEAFKKISQKDIAFLNNFIIEKDLQTQLPIEDNSIESLKKKFLIYLKGYSKDELICKGDNCFNIVSFNSKGEPGVFCGLACRKNSSYLAKKVKESHNLEYGYKSSSLNNDVKQKLVNTKLKKHYGEKWKDVNKDFFEQNIIKDDSVDYNFAKEYFGMSRQTVQKYLREFGINYKYERGHTKYEKEILTDLSLNNIEAFTTRKVLQNYQEL